MRGRQRMCNGCAMKRNVRVGRSRHFDRVTSSKAAGRSVRSARGRSPCGAFPRQGGTAQRDPATSELRPTAIIGVTSALFEPPLEALDPSGVSYLAGEPLDETCE